MEYCSHLCYGSAKDQLEAYIQSIEMRARRLIVKATRKLALSFAAKLLVYRSFIELSHLDSIIKQANREKINHCGNCQDVDLIAGFSVSRSAFHRRHHRLTSGEILSSSRKYTSKYIHIQINTYIHINKISVF